MVWLFHHNCSPALSHGLCNIAQLHEIHMKCKHPFINERVVLWVFIWHQFMACFVYFSLFIQVRSQELICGPSWKEHGEDKQTFRCSIMSFWKMACKMIILAQNRLWFCLKGKYMKGDDSVGTEEGKSEVWKLSSLWHTVNFSIKHQSVYSRHGCSSSCISIWLIKSLYVQM